MNLIVGLGNPGKKYSENRHNIGYMVVDKFAKLKSLSWRYSQDWIAYYAKTPLSPKSLEGQTGDFILLKPATFMNSSGISVSNASHFFKIDKKNIIVVHDELDLPFGKIRLTFDSLSAGHKGIDAVIESMGGNEFSRLRIGIGKPKLKAEIEKYVLKDFGKSEKVKLKDILTLGHGALDIYLKEGIYAAMNRFN